MLNWSSPGNKKDPQSLWTELKNGVLTSYTGQSGEAPVHVVNVEKLLSIGLSTPSAHEESLSFDIVTTKEKARATLTAGTYKERSKWMEWIVENASMGRLPFCPDLRRCFTRCGRVFIKDGVTGEWQTAWLIVQSQAKKLWIEKNGGAVSWHLFLFIVRQPLSTIVA